MAAATLDKRFVLYEDGRTLSAAELLLRVSERKSTHDDGLIVEVDREGVAGIMTALIAHADRQFPIFILRDPSSWPDNPNCGDGIWLQTSGTTGKPKWVSHSFTRLMSRISAGGDERAAWLLSFDAGSFAGLQVILSAMAGGHRLVAARRGASVSELAQLAVAQKVTHISGTPTFWRAFLMALDETPLILKGVTLGGEGADQSTLDALRQKFPRASLRHIYATTEAGVLFSVNDGKAGFPRAWLDTGINNVRLSISADQTLVVNNPQASDVAKREPWDTKDVVSLGDDRVIFKGRLDSMVNVGGTKVYPEEVEAFLLELPFVQEVKVSARPNPITGNILTAEVVVKSFPGDVLAALRAHVNALPRAHRPVNFHLMDRLEFGTTGKKDRVNCKAGQ